MKTTKAKTLGNVKFDELPLKHLSKIKGGNSASNDNGNEDEDPLGPTRPNSE